MINNCQQGLNATPISFVSDSDTSMDRDQFTTTNKPQNGVFSLLSTAAKRDSLAAELERGKFSFCSWFRRILKPSNQLLSVVHSTRSSTFYGKAATEEPGIHV